MAGVKAKHGETLSIEDAWYRTLPARDQRLVDLLAAGEKQKDAWGKSSKGRTARGASAVTNVHRMLVNDRFRAVVEWRKAQLAQKGAAKAELDAEEWWCKMAELIRADPVDLAPLLETPDGKLEDLSPAIRGAITGLEKTETGWKIKLSQRLAALKAVQGALGVTTERVALVDERATARSKIMENIDRRRRAEGEK